MFATSESQAWLPLMHESPLSLTSSLLFLEKWRQILQLLTLAMLLHTSALPVASLSILTTNIAIKL
jgi:hypothetical protein